jgi:hypothetical protein
MKITSPVKYIVLFAYTATVTLARGSEKGGARYDLAFFDGQSMFEAIDAIRKQGRAHIAIDNVIAKELRTTKVKKIDLSSLSIENALRVLTAANGFGLIEDNARHYFITTKARAAEWDKKHEAVIEPK